MKVICLTSIIVLSILYCQGQQPKAAASSATKGSSSSTTPTNPAKTGYVYFLKHRKHIQYASRRTETYTFTRYQFKFYSLSQTLRWPNSSTKRINDTLVLSRRVYSEMHTGFASFPEYDLVSKKADTVAILDCSKGKTTISDADTLYQATVIYYDSIPRFWDKARRWMFSRTRLRVALTQDSLTINAKLFYINYNFTPRSDIKAVTNRAYLSKIYGGETVKVDSPKVGIAIDTSLASDSNDLRIQTGKITIPTYGFADADKPFDKKQYRGMFELYEFYMRHYNQHLYWAAGASFQNPDKNHPLFADYDSLVKTRFLLDSMYIQGTRKEKLMAYIRWRFANQPPTEFYPPVQNQAAFVSCLRTINVDTLKAPAPLPTDIFHKETPEIAMAISADDSASNFYFAILPKSLLRDPMYYLRFHYATWDYGTVTVPFRYRPPQANGHILLNKAAPATAMTPAIPATATTVPSASDATLNLSAYFGRKWGATRFYEDPSTTSDQISLEPVIFTGPSLIALSATNVDTASRYMGGKNSYTYSGPSSIIAWSFGAGGVLAFKGLTIGLFGGLDCPLARNTGWVYRDKPWIGFGIGFNLGVLATGNSN